MRSARLREQTGREYRAQPILPGRGTAMPFPALVAAVIAGYFALILLLGSLVGRILRDGDR